MKAVYLRGEVSQGNFYPDIFPSWYGGQQMFRDWAPLPYYALAGLYALTDDIWVAGNLFPFLCAVGGGLSLLLFAGRTGLLLAAMGGMLYTMLPDSLRVVFADGSITRTMASALIPVGVFFMLNILDRGGRRRDFAGLVAVMGVMVVTHVMMAGILALCLGLVAASHWLLASGKFKPTALAVAALAAGLATSSWWVLPSLTGGAGEFDERTETSLIVNYPVTRVFSHGSRDMSPEALYVAAALLGGAALAALFWRRLDAWAKALIPAAAFATLLGSTLIAGFWRALPGHNLLWPTRFVPFAELAMLLLSLAAAGMLLRTAAAPGRRWVLLCAAAMPVLLFIDFRPSLALAHTREASRDVSEMASALKGLTGWRVATMDLSRLGTAPAMLFTTEGGREQVFGAAFQGAETAPLLGRINEAVIKGHLAYAVSRLERLGTDDVVMAPQPEMDHRLVKELETAGYVGVKLSGGLSLYHRDGAPRAVLAPVRVLGIGRGAHNLALMFPEVIVGASSDVNEYDPAFLAQFDTLVLSGFTYSERDKAEDTVKTFASSGKRVVIDFTGAPPDVFARVPKFLGVYGEPLPGIGQATLTTRDGVRPLRPFSTEYGPWLADTPQGADETVVSFRFAAVDGTAVARNRYGSGDVTFIGLNLIYHAALTGDMLAISLLEDAVGIPAGRMPEDSPLPLLDYKAAQDGWTFRVDLPSEQWVLLPMARHDGTSIEVNGGPIESVGIEGLTLAKLPAGKSSIRIRSGRSGIYAAGYALTALSALAVAAYLARGWLKPRRQAAVTPAAIARTAQR